jgi:uncharacterized OB-fold protein
VSPALVARLQQLAGAELISARRSADGVNPAMIRHWCAAMGDDNPRYAPGPDQIAPPAMLQAWCMREFGPEPDSAAATRLNDLLTELGCTAVVATDCEQAYTRDLRIGDVPVQRRVIESISGEKQTALGRGYFVTTLDTYTVDDETVATMRLRTLRYQPKQAAAGTRPRPSITQDNSFFFEGARQGTLLVRQCATCGRFQHPPTPMCPACNGLSWQPRPMSGRGTVYTFTVTHHPQFPGFPSPFVVALVELEEGPRIVSNLVGTDPSEVSIGMPVEVAFTAVDPELTLPLFRPALVKEEASWISR